MSGSIKCFLVTAAEDQHSAGALHMPACHLFYSVGPDGTLTRRGLPISARGGIMGVFDDGSAGWSEAGVRRLARDIAAECARRSYGGVLLDFPESTPGLEAARCVCSVLAARRIAHFLPLGLAGASESAKILVPSDVSGGSFADMLRHYTVRFPPQRLCLELVRICSDFLLPAQCADGRTLSARQFAEILARENPQCYFSAELCAKYFTWRDGSGQLHFLLYDDPSTAAHKIITAGQCGYFSAFLLYRDWGAAAADIAAQCRPEVQTL